MADSVPSRHERQTPTHGGNAEAERAEPEQAVDARRDQHRRHERRNAARRRGMRLGQPHMQRDDARLHAEPDEEQHEQRRRAVGPETTMAGQQRRERRASRTPPPATESRRPGSRCRRATSPDRDSAARRLARTSCSVATSAAVASVISSHANRKAMHAIGHEHDLHGAQQHVERRRRRRPCGTGRPRGRNTRAVERDRDRDQAEHHQKPGGQRRHGVAEARCRMPRDGEGRRQSAGRGDHLHGHGQRRWPTPGSSRPARPTGRRRARRASSSVAAMVTRRIDKRRRQAGRRQLEACSTQLLHQTRSTRLTTSAITYAR